MTAQRERKLQATREWKKKNKERHAELARAYRRRNPEKTKAQNRLNYAISTGRIERQPCEICGASERIHAHHHDYSKPLDVRWLCFLCHKAEHPVSDEDKRIKVDDHVHARLLGSDNPNASLKDEEVREIKELIKAGFSQERIGKLFGVAQTTVSRIKLKQCYSNIN